MLNLVVLCPLLGVIQDACTKVTPTSNSVGKLHIEILNKLIYGRSQNGNGFYCTKKLQYFVL